ncbi:DNA glycosylase AlkZ-like family protein, partial [Streptomyces althioticus]
VAATVLVDGKVAGRWRLVRAKKAVTLEIEPFAPFAASDREQVLAEGEALLAFAGEDAEERNVRFV